jgi:excisionase family DNA binding protein
MTVQSSQQSSDVPAVLDNHMSIQAAAEYSGYNENYLRRLAKAGAIKAIKIGQMWLVTIDSLNAYLKSVQSADDRRFGPRVYHEHIQQQK